MALLPLGNAGLWPVRVALPLAAVLSVVVLRRWAGRALLPGLCFPLAAAVSVVLLLRATWLGWRHGGIDWRTDRYAAAMLREGARVSFP